MELRRRARRLARRQTPASTPRGRRPPAAPTSRSPCSTPASSGTTAARWSTCAARRASTRASCRRPRHDRDHAARGRRQLRGLRCRTYDANGDGVFNVVDYACDARVQPRPGARRSASGPRDLLDPQDVLIAFTDGADDDGNGYVDDIVGWDFLDDDNDPYDDVQYGHGTGEARDSTAEADNGGDLGTCPNCMVIHLRVGDSFVADVNRFAQAVIYAADNGVAGRAGGARHAQQLDASRARPSSTPTTTASPVIASAADEAAQHHNWPSSAAARDRRQLGHEVRRDVHARRRAPTCSSTAARTSPRKITLAIPSSVVLVRRDRPRRRAWPALDLQRRAERARGRDARARTRRASAPTATRARSAPTRSAS